MVEDIEWEAEAQRRDVGIDSEKGGISNCVEVKDF